MGYELGKILKTIRVNKEFTQQKLAGMVHVEPSTISKIECGTSNPSVDLLRLIAIALDTSADILLEIYDVEKSSPRDMLQLSSQVKETQGFMYRLSQQFDLLLKNKPDVEEDIPPPASNDSEPDD